MKTKYFFASAAVVCVVIAGTLAAAQTLTTNTNADLMLSDEACRQLTAYQPGVDGSADYKPGVDVTGKPVVEADIGGAAIPVPEAIEFQLSVDMAQYLGYYTSPQPEGYVDLGTITVLPDGQVLRNGAPMETQAETALRALCEGNKIQ